MSSPLEETGRPWLCERAARDPNKFALGYGDIRYSFQELADRAKKSAARLCDLGVDRGDRVAILMDASARTVELIHAVQRIGAVLVPLNTRLSVAEIAPLIRTVEPRVVIYDREYAGSLTGIDCKSRYIESHDEFDAIAVAPAAPIRPVEPDAVHTIIFTSGTTGIPKGAMLTNRNHFASATASRSNIEAHRDDVWLNFMPLFHVGGLSIILRSVIDGTPVILQRGFDPHRVNVAIRADRISLFSAVSTMLARILDDNGDDAYPPSLRCVLLGGGPIPTMLVDRAAQVGMPVAPTYGLTETASQVATASIGDPIIRRGSVGRPLNGTEIRLVCVDKAGRGEILVKGPTVMAGYYRDADATSRVLRDGWLMTGDIGRLDSSGNLYIEDRRSDLIVTGGENVYPAEVEAVLLAHPAIAEAAVFAITDEHWGHRVAAAIVKRGGTDVDEAMVRRWCGARLAGFKVPRVVIFVDEIPRTASGKIKRTMLRDRYRRAHIN